ncbi:preprotein translocase subunit SecE [Ruminococcus sp. CLA-AA-H200]|uniref:Preprotein translocase subunit SecE n=1 Tax=Ruminococcus turbiniformis TaxID=2881258 RepID=A0ABS8FZ69_9FIRM|nr:preprotein translocase subunit SecE [Ruminococcus turbiniformis]MCC2254608.1 preprotein translocase subunit SecE [Ruminococcus turbiniformis]
MGKNKKSRNPVQMLKILVSEYKQISFPGRKKLFKDTIFVLIMALIFGILFSSIGASVTEGISFLLGQL